mmetsp:Transcript_31494/g.83996  ORF Transcript_31494/g.83996 Transcript_31494/m.83996 type:complete len:90 (+) Transcript_31494:1257-1526(+)
MIVVTLVLVAVLLVVVMLFTVVVVIELIVVVIVVVVVVAVFVVHGVTVDNELVLTRLTLMSAREARTMQNDAEQPECIAWHGTACFAQT